MKLPAGITVPSERRRGCRTLRLNETFPRQLQILTSSLQRPVGVLTQPRMVDALGLLEKAVKHRHVIDRSQGPAVFGNDLVQLLAQQGYALWHDAEVEERMGCSHGARMHSSQRDEQQLLDEHFGTSVIAGGSLSHPLYHILLSLCPGWISQPLGEDVAEAAMGRVQVSLESFDASQPLVN